MLSREHEAYNILETLIENSDYGDLRKSDIVKAKQKIHSPIQNEEQAEIAIDKSIGKLDNALSTLGIE